MSCGIYKITNQINGKVYIGQSVNIENRWHEHQLAACHKNFYGHVRTRLYPAMKKYGLENFSFSIIEECNADDLDEKEEYWIKKYSSTDPNKGYNLLSGGKQGHQFKQEIFQQLWDEGKTIKEIVEITGASYTTIENNLKYYENYSIQQSLSRSILQVTYQNDNKIEKTPVYQYDLLGNYIAAYKSIAEATRAVTNGELTHGSISQAINCSSSHMAYGYLWSKEKVEKMPMYTAQKYKPVQCIETGQIYVSTREAARAYNMKSPSSIIACCQGRQKSAAKDLITGKPLHWRYYNTQIEEWHPNI